MRKPAMLLIVIACFSCGHPTWAQERPLIAAYEFLLAKGDMVQDNNDPPCRDGALDNTEQAAKSLALGGVTAFLTAHPELKTVAPFIGNAANFIVEQSAAFLRTQPGWIAHSMRDTDYASCALVEIPGNRGLAVFISFPNDSGNWELCVGNDPGKANCHYGNYVELPSQRNSRIFRIKNWQTRDISIRIAFKGDGTINDP